MNTHHADAAPMQPAEWPPTQQERDRLHQQALERAHTLRSEAIDAFWRGTERWWLDAAVQSRRAGDRLAARLRRHRAQRGSAACPQRMVET